jgi:hypothetical protein
MKRFFLSATLLGATIAPAFAGDGAAAAPDGLRDGILAAVHMVAHALGLI